MSRAAQWVQEEHGVVVVKAPAAMTANTTYDLEETLLPFALKESSLMLLDMSEVTQITSAAISFLVKLTKSAHRNRGMVAIASPAAVVRDVFAITKMRDVFHVYDTREEAMKALLPDTGAAQRAPSPPDKPSEAVAQTTLLYGRPGPQHTERTLEAVRQRASELGLGAIIVATTTGATALKAAELCGGRDVEIVAVTLMAGVWRKYAPPDPELVRKAKEAGVKFLTATHPLMGNVGSAIREKFGGVPEVELIAHAYYTFSQGMKVAVEVATMVADAGILSTEKDAIAVAGTGSGADTAIVIRPACSNHFFETKIREIIAMPR